MPAHHHPLSGVCLLIMKYKSCNVYCPIVHAIITSYKEFNCCWSVHCCSAWGGGDQLLPAVTGRGGPAVRPARRAAVRLPRARPLLGLRRHRVPPPRLPGGHAVGRPGLHLHVDERGSIPGRAEATALRDCADQDPMPVLDGLHLDISGHDVLSSPPGLQPTQVRFLLVTFRYMHIRTLCTMY